MISELLRGIEAVTFDFFNTLVYHREGHGRGRAVVEYLRGHGIEGAPWRHEILYEVFDGFERDGSPAAPPDVLRRRRVALAERLLERLEIAAAAREAERHADALWSRLGPPCFEIFTDVPATLDALRSAGYPLAIVSNWPSGLGHFCRELGLDARFDTIVCSAEVGAAKPDARIFAEACRRLGVAPEKVLHVGDTFVDDYVGGTGAGLRAVLIDRGRGAGGARIDCGAGSRIDASADAGDDGGTGSRIDSGVDAADDGGTGSRFDGGADAVNAGSADAGIDSGTARIIHGLDELVAH